MPKYKAGKEPGAKKKSELKRPVRIEADGKHGDRIWPTGSGHPKAQKVKVEEDE